MRVQDSNARQLLSLACFAFIFVSIFDVVVPKVTGGDKKEYIDGVMLGEEFAVKFREHYSTHTALVDNYDEFHFYIQIGDLTYVGAYHKDLTHLYKPKAEDWPKDMAVKIHFEKKSFYGMARRTFMFVKRPDGKEVKTELFSVIGPDGKERCGKFMCG